MESAAASAFLRSVMGRLFLVLEKEYNKHRGLAQETQSIQQDLRMIAAAMDDRIRALGRHERTAVARLYSEEMLDLAHDIEDCVDRYMHRLSCKHKHKHRGGGGGAASSWAHRVAHELKKVQSRSSFADEIQKLKRRLKEAHQRVIDAVPLACGGQPSGLPSCMVASSNSRPCRVTRNPVGIEKPMEEVQLLLDEVEGELQQLRVISIVGFGGIGKTTLARAVYDSPQAKEKFQCRAWVAATGSAGGSPEQIRGILRDIHQQVLPRDTMDFDNNHLEASLKEYLSDKRYLIVIDDVQMDEWRIVKSAFEHSSTSSRIILTTTIQPMANMCSSHGNGYVYQMDTLGEEDSKKIAFPPIRSPELEHGSAALLRKCDGLPLALVSVSDYLKSSVEPTGELCANLCRNIGCHLKEDNVQDNFSDLRKVLLDSYDSLSGYALSCFLYLGIFPNNRPLKKKVVTRRWIAEGYARSESLRDEQDIADDNFNKLVDWNIIRPVDTRNNSKVKTCRTHGIMHEFVLHKSFSQRFIMKLSPDHPRMGANARHLSVHDGKLTECMASDEDLSRVRSLTVVGDAGGAISYARRCKLIRVLDLEQCSDLKEHDLKHICKLWHLKYLSLGDSIHELPRCIDGLHCLETLDLRRTKINSLPIEAIQLPHLTHLFGKIMLDKDDLKNGNKMSKLEKFLSEKKSNLQTFAGFVTDDSKGFLQLINHMSKLRKVKIWCKRVAVANSSSYINDLSKAIQKFTEFPMDRDNDCSLSLDSSDEPSKSFLSSLVMEPCSEGSKYDLRSLKLQGNLLQLPPFVTLLSGLKDLCISSPTLRLDVLSGLANFGKLLYLKLIANQFDNFKIKQGTLPSLRRLCFVVQSVSSGLPTFEQGALPNLVSLQLLCQGLVGLSGIDIRHFKHLKEVTICAEATAQTRQDWEHAAKNHPNRPRVMLVKANPMESEELGPCTMREKRKKFLDQPSLDDSLKKMRLSESSWTQAVNRQVMTTATIASSSVPIHLLAEESGSWMQKRSHP